MVSHNLEQNIIDGEKTINNCLEGQVSHWVEAGGWVGQTLD